LPYAHITLARGPSACGPGHTMPPRDLVLCSMKEIFRQATPPPLCRQERGNVIDTGGGSGGGPGQPAGAQASAWYCRPGRVIGTMSGSSGRGCFTSPAWESMWLPGGGLRLEGPQLGDVPPPLNWRLSPCQLHARRGDAAGRSGFPESGATAIGQPLREVRHQHRSTEYRRLLTPPWHTGTAEPTGRWRRGG
jgi:hypothetical protein